MEIVGPFKDLLEDWRQSVWNHLEIAASGRAGEPEMSDKLLQRAAAGLTREMQGLYNQTCCRHVVAQLLFCAVPSLLGGVAQVVRATVS
jgi:hypothetical protein